MKVWVPTALALILTAGWASTAVDAGPCARDKSRNCFDVPPKINFSSVPEISDHIVNQEKVTQKPQKLNNDPPAPAPYTGPIIGASPLRSKVPTVGFSWSLD
jgi:hypothetical protein